VGSGGSKTGKHKSPATPKFPCPAALMVLVHTTVILTGCKVLAIWTKPQT